jgi:hypothetical protein
MDNLSKDMVACREAGFGCHYGAWKATQKPVKTIPLPTDKNETRCLNCGRIIIQRSRRPLKYCDAQCGIEYRYKREHGLLEEGR